jgi:hypothetical protein
MGFPAISRTRAATQVRPMLGGAGAHQTLIDIAVIAV